MFFFLYAVLSAVRCFWRVKATVVPVRTTVSAVCQADRGARVHCHDDDGNDDCHISSLL